jgi:hypothetical protein
MWYGFSLYDMALIIANECKKRLIFIFGYLMLNVYQFFYSRGISSSKINKIFSRITIIIFTTLMFQQLISVIKIYLSGEIMTRFDIYEIKLLPFIKFDITPNMKNLNELIEIYPIMGKELPNFSPNASLSLNETQNLHSIYTEYSLQLLYDNKLNDFQRIADMDRIVRTCDIILEKSQLNCTKGDFGFYLETHLFWENYLYFTEIEDRNTIEKITMRLNKFSWSLSAKLFLSNSLQIPITELMPEKNALTKVVFSSLSIQKLNTNENKCIEKNDEKHFSEDYFDFCRLDCIFSSNNQSFGCIPIHEIHVYFNRYILEKGYKFCDDSKFSGNYSAVEEFDKECDLSCKPKCNFINFDSKVEISRYDLNETVLELIPQKSPRVACIEVWKTDFNKMIYNFGGVLGLWFGLSPLSFVDLILNISQLYTILIAKCIRIAHQLKNFKLRLRFHENFDLRIKLLFLLTITVLFNTLLLLIVNI